MIILAQRGFRLAGSDQKADQLVLALLSQWIRRDAPVRPLQRPGQVADLFQKTD